MGTQSLSPTPRTERTVFKRSSTKMINEDPSDSTPTPLASSNDSGILHARIQTRAYELYEERGFQEDHGLDDWVQAEREIGTPQ
ncbi:MAG: DUF2934 domain-containing protein [Nitrospiraceae bacterium]|nr:DUF2934 domain-containing protein [Nitrospiraceae bacterium]